MRSVNLFEKKYQCALAPGLEEQWKMVTGPRLSRPPYPQPEPTYGWGWVGAVGSSDPNT